MTTTTAERCRYRGLKGTAEPCGKVKLGGLLCPDHDLTTCEICGRTDTTGRRKRCECGELLGIHRPPNK